MTSRQNFLFRTRPTYAIPARPKKCQLTPYPVIEGPDSGRVGTRPFKTLNLENGKPISGKSAYDWGWVWVQRVVATL